MSNTEDQAGPIIAAIGANGGEAALAMAIKLSAREGSTLLVVSVVEVPPIYNFEARRELLIPWMIDQQIADRRAVIYERFTAGASLTRSKPATVEVAYGDPADEIARIAREQNARLIVMGIGPGSAMMRFGKAGTAYATARLAPCPILAVAKGAADLPRSVVAATDFSPESINGIRECLPLLADGAVVRLVHAWQRLPSILPELEMKTVHDAYIASLPEQFYRVRTAFGPQRLFRFETIVREGRPAESVLSVANEVHADLIVTGTHGYGTVERWMLGSTATALLRAASCSVLIAPPPPVAERSRLTRHMTGTSTVRSPDTWNAELSAFVQRNGGRRTTLEMDGYGIGAQVQQSGYYLVGAAYDVCDEHLALMFSGNGDDGRHLTRSLADVRSVSIASGRDDKDLALSVDCADGRALLTFVHTSKVDANAAPA